MVVKEGLVTALAVSSCLSPTICANRNAYDSPKGATTGSVLEEILRFPTIGRPPARERGCTQAERVGQACEHALDQVAQAGRVDQRQNERAGRDGSSHHDDGLDDPDVPVVVLVRTDDQDDGSDQSQHRHEAGNEAQADHATLEHLAAGAAEGRQAQAAEQLGPVGPQTCLGAVLVGQPVVLGLGGLEHSAHVTSLQLLGLLGSASGSCFHQVVSTL